MVVSVVDASGSMAARDQLTAVTDTVTSLLRDIYQSRDKVTVIAFRGDSAELVLPPTKSIDTAIRCLADARIGNRTPLAEGLLKIHEVVVREAHRESTRRTIMVLFSDGRATGKNGLQWIRAVAVKIRR